MYKLLKFSALSLLAVLLSLSLLSCSGDEHEHSWGEWQVVKVASCGSSGYSIRTCSICGEEDRSVQYATPHEYSSVYNFDSTHHWRDAICQHQGEIVDRERHIYEDGTCKVCGALLGSTVSQGLQYVGILGKGVYKVIGIGTTLDTNVVIARYLNSAEIVAVGDSAFEGVEGLESVTMQVYITEIGSRAFARCEQLKSVRFTKAVEHIGSEIFDGCTSLETVYFDGTVAEFHAIEKAGDWKSGVGSFKVVCTDTYFIENGGANDPVYEPDTGVAD